VSADPCPEGVEDCLDDFTLVVLTRYGSLVPQTVHAASLRETFTKVLDLPLTAWIPDEPLTDMVDSEECAVCGMDVSPTTTPSYTLVHWNGRSNELVATYCLRHQPTSTTEPS
jgi:hypothetical protein